MLSLPAIVTLDGKRREVSAEEALLLDLRQKLRRDDPSAAELMAEYADVIWQLRQPNDVGVAEIRRIIVAPGSVGRHLELLRMAKKFDRYGSQSSMKLEPWLVQAALARLGGRRLSRGERRKVYAATRTPQKVQWPDWWINQD